MRRADKFERVISFCSAVAARAFVYVEIMMQLHKRPVRDCLVALVQLFLFPREKKRENRARKSVSAIVNFDYALPNRRRILNPEES